MGRRICLSIGVSEVKPRADDGSQFAVLDGAINAAKCIGNWALAAGFGPPNVSIITDAREEGAVTVDRIRQAVASLFPNGAVPVDHMVLSFCGHGLTGAEVNTIYWLFSDSLAEQYRVLVDAFTTELLKYGIGRITLISDACRDVPPDIDIQRLDGRRVLIGPGQAVKSPRFDRLVACQDGKTAFMVSEQGSALPGKCIFSGVVGDVLWKREPNAIVSGEVTTQGLGTVARDRATERAQNYSLELYPQCMVDPSPAILVASAPPLPAEVSPQAWPAGGTSQTMGRADPRTITWPAPGQFDPRTIGMSAAIRPDTLLKRVNSDAELRTSILGANFGKTIQDLDFSQNSFELPEAAAQPLFDLVKWRRVSNSTGSRAERSLAAGKAANSLRQIEGAAAAHARRKAAVQLRENEGIADLGNGPPGTNLVTSSSGVKQIWASRKLAAKAIRSGDGSHSYWQIAVREPNTTILVETDDGFFVPATLYPDIFATVSADPRGGYVIAYGSKYEPESILQAFEPIAALAAGKLTPAVVDQMAAEMRRGKHIDPVRGVISAYLYRGVADIDSIRRMAYFYFAHNQAVPFDIALLGDLAVSRDAKGRLRAIVPPVPKRKGPRGKLPGYVIQATPQAQVLIGGYTPWLSVGWDYVADPAPEWKLLVEGLKNFAHDIARSGFTNFPSKQGWKFAKLRDMQPLLKSKAGRRAR